MLSYFSELSSSVWNEFYFCGKTFVAWLYLTRHNVIIETVLQLRCLSCISSVCRPWTRSYWASRFRGRRWGDAATRAPSNRSTLSYTSHTPTCRCRRTTAPSSRPLLRGSCPPRQWHRRRLRPTNSGCLSVETVRSARARWRSWRYPA